MANIIERLRTSCFPVVGTLVKLFIGTEALHKQCKFCFVLSVNSFCCLTLYGMMFYDSQAWWHQKGIREVDAWHWCFGRSKQDWDHLDQRLRHGQFWVLVFQWLGCTKSRYIWVNCNFCFGVWDRTLYSWHRGNLLLDIFLDLLWPRYKN